MPCSDSRGSIRVTELFYSILMNVEVYVKVGGPFADNLLPQANLHITRHPIFFAFPSYAPSFPPFLFTSLRPLGPGLGGQSPAKPSRNPLLPGGIASEKKRRSWDELSTLDKKDPKYDPKSDLQEDPWGSKQEMSLRKSLSATLVDLSDREGLTDDELESKVISLV